MPTEAKQLVKTMSLPLWILIAKSSGLWPFLHFSPGCQTAVVLKNRLAVLLASFSTSALSFALDLLLGVLLRAYPSTALLPVAWGLDTTWVEGTRQMSMR